jgi:hypothetical protein
MADRVHYRLAKYERWVKNCAYLGGGLGGLVLFGDLAKDTFQLAPPLLRALFVTFVVAAGGGLGRAYVGYLSASHKLESWRKNAGQSDDVEVPADSKYRYPRSSKLFFWFALVCGGVAAALLIAAAWWPVCCSASR